MNSLDGFFPIVCEISNQKYLITLQSKFIIIK